MATKIVTKNSSTAGSAPSASDLVQGELAVNVADKRLYTEDAAGAIVELGTNPSTLNVDGTATMDGLTVAGASATNATDSATNTVSTGLTIGHNTSGTTATGFGTALAFASENSTYSSVNTHATIESVVTDEVSVNSDLNFYTKYANSLQKRMSFNNDGDVSFYEDTGTTAKFFWDASAKSLGIGTASPFTGIDLRGTSASAGNTIQIIGNSVSTLLLGQDADGGVIRGQGGNNALKFYTGGTGDSAANASGAERMRIDSAGHAIIPAGITLGTAAGVYSAANTLDDYEEGTWTPVTGPTSTTATYVLRSGYYTKVGNLVTCTFGLKHNGGVWTGGEATILGLPFTVDTTGSFQEPQFIVTSIGGCPTGQGGSAASGSFNLGEVGFYCSGTEGRGRSYTLNADTTMAANAIFATNSYIKATIIYHSS